MATKKTATKKSAAHKAVPAKKAASKKAAPTRSRPAVKRGARVAEAAFLLEPGDVGRGPEDTQKVVNLVIIKSEPATISTSGSVYSQTGLVEPGDIRARRTRKSKPLKLTPGKYKYIFKIMGPEGKLTLCAQDPDGLAIGSPLDCDTSIRDGLVYSFEVRP